MIPDKLYDILKWFAILGLPAIGTLYATLSGIWGFPYGKEVVETILALDTFLGTILGISSIHYKNKIEKEENDK